MCKRSGDSTKIHARNTDDEIIREFYKKNEELTNYVFMKETCRHRAYSRHLKKCAKYFDEVERGEII